MEKTPVTHIAYADLPKPERRAYYLPQSWTGTPSASSRKWTLPECQLIQSAAPTC
ncbi:hypothetical protein [Actinoplanes utahensis]|uniref:hypothetical protein n=1 Tax=Actinoplanes utahensis TaxID=1869 RepID=UPI000A44F534|nr:hypothetical protein [Actinoplanes utahensis]GIF28335.1 hypothetical protein Aut01nite_13210 [Actinoplanes utahensis]